MIIMKTRNEKQKTNNLFSIIYFYLENNKLPVRPQRDWKTEPKNLFHSKHPYLVMIIRIIV